jgi:hypothetical protein
MLSTTMGCTSWGALRFAATGAAGSKSAAHIQMSETRQQRGVANRSKLGWRGVTGERGKGLDFMVVRGV